MYGYIYIFTLLPTGKIYIGQHRASKFDENYFGSGKAWSQSCAQYSKTDIKREILEWCTSKQELDNRETHWIRYYRSYDPSIGYNLTDQARGVHVTPKFIASCKARQKRLWSDPHYRSHM